MVIMTVIKHDHVDLYSLFWLYKTTGGDATYTVRSNVRNDKALSESPVALLLLNALHCLPYSLLVQVFACVLLLFFVLY